MRNKREYLLAILEDAKGEERSNILAQIVLLDEEDGND